MNIFHLFMNTALLVIKYSPGTCREPRVDDAGSEGADRNSPLKSTHSGWGEIGGQWKCKKDYFLVSDKCEKEWSKEMGQASLRGGGFRRLIGVQPRLWWVAKRVVGDRWHYWYLSDHRARAKNGHVREEFAVFQIQSRCLRSICADGKKIQMEISGKSNHWITHVTYTSLSSSMALCELVTLWLSEEIPRKQTWSFSSCVNRKWLGWAGRSSF